LDSYQNRTFLVSETIQEAKPSTADGNGICL